MDGLQLLFGIIGSNMFGSFRDSVMASGLTTLILLVYWSFLVIEHLVNAYEETFFV